MQPNLNKLVFSSGLLLLAAVINPKAFHSQMTINNVSSRQAHCPTPPNQQNQKIVAQSLLKRIANTFYKMTEVNLYILFQVCHLLACLIQCGLGCKKVSSKKKKRVILLSLCLHNRVKKESKKLGKATHKK